MNIFKTALFALMGAAYGSIVPSKMWGKKLLAQELGDNGISLVLLPDECLQELADDAIRTAENIAKLYGKKCSLPDLIEAIEQQAYSVINHLDRSRSNDDPFEQSLQKFRQDNDSNPVREILERYCVLAKSAD